VVEGIERVEEDVALFREGWGELNGGEGVRAAIVSVIGDWVVLCECCGVFGVITGVEGTKEEVERVKEG
jgi:hypothetical protein